MNFNFDKSDSVVYYNEYCLILEDGTKVYKYVPQCGSCNEEIYYTDEFGNKIEDAVEETNAVTCDENCCQFTINSNRNGIQNEVYFNNFIYGNVTGNNWNDFLGSFRLQGGIVQSYCPDVACNITTFNLCGLSFNSPLLYTDENGNQQEIITTCSKSCCRQEQVIERCACIDEIKQTIQLGIYTDTGEEIGWYINSSTGENIKRPVFVDCSCNFECE